MVDLGLTASPLEEPLSGDGYLTNIPSPWEYCNGGFLVPGSVPIDEPGLRLPCRWTSSSSILCASNVARPVAPHDAILSIALEPLTPLTVFATPPPAHPLCLLPEAELCKADNIPSPLFTNPLVAGLEPSTPPTQLPDVPGELLRFSIFQIVHSPETVTLHPTNFMTSPWRDVP